MYVFVYFNGLTYRSWLANRSRMLRELITEYNIRRCAGMVMKNDIMPVLQDARRLIKAYKPQ